jgi:hypothetical protein
MQKVRVISYAEENIVGGALRPVICIIVLLGFMLNISCQPNRAITSPPPDITSSPVTTSDPGNAKMTPSPPPPVTPQLQKLIDQSRQDLAQRLGINVDDISLLEASSVTWPDASLGCPREGMGYAQVLTPGYLIRLQAGEQEYEYHAGRGMAVIYCENPTPPVPGTPGDI